MSALAARNRQPPSRGAPPPAPRLRVVNPVEDPAVEQRLNRQCVEASIVLREARGEAFRRPKSKAAPHQALDELDIMLERGEITRQQFKAGRMYGDRYREAHFRGVYRSSIRLNDRSRTALSYEGAIMDRVGVIKKLHRDRTKVFGKDRHTISLCDALLGEDWRISSNRAERAQTVEWIGWALTRLAYHYGTMW